MGRQNLKRRDVDSPQRDKFRARSGREGESQKQRRGENWKKQTSTDRNPQEQNSERRPPQSWTVLLPNCPDPETWTALFAPTHEDWGCGVPHTW